VTRAEARASRPLLLASAGIGVVGTTYGMARYGFGLLAPEISATFHLGHRAIGLLAAASYVTYLATSITAAALAVRIGPRAVVGAGGVLAVTGMLVAGAAGSPGTLFVGLLVAGASAGLVFPPFSDVVNGALAADRRGRVLAAISSGTGWGVAVAGPIALLAGGGWRVAWLLFSATAALATVWAVTVLPGRSEPVARREIVRLSRSWFVCPRSAPLLAEGLVIGLASSVYWTFAVEHLQRPGGLSIAESQIVLAVVGVASVGGTAGADVIRRLGARASNLLAAAAEAAALLLVGLAPGTLATGLASAVLFGAAYNTIVAAQVIRSAGVFAARPSAGLAAVMIMNALGLLAGAPLFGTIADATGLSAAFVAGAVLVLGTVVLAPRGDGGDGRGRRLTQKAPPRSR
jgi:predicted MFS family arabinose efflux permease